METWHSPRAAFAACYGSVFIEPETLVWHFAVGLGSACGWRWLFVHPIERIAGFRLSTTWCELLISSSRKVRGFVLVRIGVVWCMDKHFLCKCIHKRVKSDPVGVGYYGRSTFMMREELRQVHVQDH